LKQRPLLPNIYDLIFTILSLGIVISPPSPLILITSTLLAYLIGGLPFGYWFVRLTAGKDIRSMGSGNIGATNVHRTQGTAAGVSVLLLDILKGIVAVWLARELTDDSQLAAALAASAVMLGHCYPVFLGFKGGKAVAAFIGAFLFLTPWALLCTTVVFVLVVSFSRYISLGSIVGAMVFPLSVVLFEHASREIFAASLFASVLVIYRHKANMARLRAGTENVFSFSSRKKD
jgi:acyl phosphate:glycerol-3-phosphate acyltransferase